MTPPPDEARRIRDEDGYLTKLGEQLGRARFEKLVHLLGDVQGQMMFLTMGVAAVPGTGYNDKALENMRTDASDLLKAASELTRFTVGLADAWQRQRVLAEARDEP